jgi:deoxyhypusine synthase
MLNEMDIDRIYDTFIDENELCECDQKVQELAGALEKRPYSSREFVWHMGKYLEENGCKSDRSVILSAYRKNVPIFIPAFSDCSAGFGLLDYQRQNPDEHLTIDSVRDFRELVDIVLEAKETGLVMLGGGVPKNFVQDSVLGGEVDTKGRLVDPARMHKYAVQITVADPRDGALSGSTLKEACSWGKVELTNEQMVFSEIALALPLLASYAYHKGSWKNRSPRDCNKSFTGD